MVPYESSHPLLPLAYIGMSPWDPPKAKVIMFFQIAGGQGVGRLTYIPPGYEEILLQHADLRASALPSQYVTTQRERL